MVNDYDSNQIAQELILREQDDFYLGLKYIEANPEMAEIQTYEWNLVENSIQCAQ